MLFISISGLSTARASLPSPPRNGVLKTGSAIQDLIESRNPDSLRRKCARENAGTRLFSSFCREFVDQLQKKINLMVVETDIQIQAERLSPSPMTADPKSRLDLLIQLNAAAIQAEQSIRALKAGYSERSYKEHLSEILPDSKKVRDIFEAYAKLNPDGRS
jgi:hypothetical protein